MRFLGANQYSGKSAEERFWEKVHKTETCWNWVASTTRFGYGHFEVNKKLIEAHRYSYQLAHAKIPRNLDIDHLCRNPKCVRPSHLEAVSHRENVLRGIGLAALNAKKTHCKRGHQFTVENTKLRPWKGRHKRQCAICLSNYWKARWQKTKKATPDMGVKVGLIKELMK